MSTLLGSSSERWTLAQAVDALADSARRAGVPGWIWFAGVLYPSLNINVDLVRSFLRFVGNISGVEIPGSGEVAPILLLFAPHLPGIHGWERLLLLPLIAPIYRLIVGLAKVSDPRNWEDRSSEALLQVHVGVIAEESLKQRRRTVSMRVAWEAGRGLGLVAFGMWLMLLALLLGAMLCLIGPLLALVSLLGLTDFSALFTGLLIPVLGLLLAYAIVLMVLNQLALHSLAHNRRGVASALTHAWRLIRSSPWSALRATLVDFVLFLSILVAAQVLSGLLGATVFAFLSPFVVLALYGFGGVTRALFWARTYRALGGLSSADHVPGL